MPTEPPLPKAAARLIETARAAGWKTLVERGESSGGAPFITIHAGTSDPYRYYRITWHTRDTGTYRLFTSLCRTWRRYWHDAPSLRTITAVITAEDDHAAVQHYGHDWCPRCATAWPCPTLRRAREEGR